MKKNNKGFSLVELIVVVLILGILVVVATPQLLNWGGKSKENTDAILRESVESCASVAVLEFMETGAIAAEEYKVTTGSVVVLDGGTDANAGLANMILTALDDAVSPKSSPITGYFKIEVEAVTGQVTVSVVE